MRVDAGAQRTRIKGGARANFVDEKLVNVHVEAPRELNKGYIYIYAGAVQYVYLCALS